MRVLAGGPAREAESAVFALHVAGLEAQNGAAAGANNYRADVEVRHDIVTDEGGPRWHPHKIARVADARQRFLDEVDLVSYPEAVFMVDTDVVCGPGVLERMWAVDADVVYGVFWTEDDWGQPGPIAPQVWTHHPYVMDDGVWEVLNRPGVHEVEVRGGGACTLFRGRAFESRYFPLLESIAHVGGMWAGEDRSYALGLECRGIKQVAVTGLPIAHCYATERRPWMADPDYLDVIRTEVGL